MKIQLLAIDQIIPYARNPRNNTQAVAKVATSLQAFGWKQPIVVDKDQIIIVGHTRWLAAKQLGMTEVPVVVATDLTPAQAKAYRLADNRTHEESSWNNDLLALELEDLRQLDLELDSTGFDPDEIQGLLALADAVEQGLTDEDDCPATPEQPITQPGDLWQLGRHRLLCGDSTVLVQVEKLMAGELADLVFTDPPYNVDYEGYTADKLTMARDHQSDTEFQAFLLATFASMAKVVKPTASFYVCHGSCYQREFQQALEANGLKVRNQLIWAKQHFAWGLGRYKFQHEPIFYGHCTGQTDPWYGDKSQSTLWSVDKPTANRLHPTMKPIALIEKALHNSSQAGNIVLDLFGGSGSTLIAAEKTARQARLMEIDPHYCDVIIQRWQDFTGQSAKRPDNRHFAPIKVHA